jgi:hypothetical protein
MFDHVQNDGLEKVDDIALRAEPPRWKRIDENIATTLEHNSEKRLLHDTRHKSYARVDWLRAVGQEASDYPKILGATGKRRAFQSRFYIGRHLRKHQIS